ncbi:hypothetical protein RND81_06G022200 [Saponaria officinalis]|uniref:Transmembrane protein n=1 Tax=Saponaria officinalis TaxID=3572 RepID=A0AAW1K8S3_SAPOF
MAKFQIICLQLIVVVVLLFIVTGPPFAKSEHDDDMEKNARIYEVTTKRWDIKWDDVLARLQGLGNVKKISNDDNKVVGCIKHGDTCSVLNFGGCCSGLCIPSFGLVGDCA